MNRLRRQIRKGLDKIKSLSVFDTLGLFVCLDEGVDVYMEIWFGCQFFVGI
jgi:hypothetical protein